MFLTPVYSQLLDALQGFAQIRLKDKPAHKKLLAEFNTLITDAKDANEVYFEKIFFSQLESIRKATQSGVFAGKSQDLIKALRERIPTATDKEQIRNIIKDVDKKAKVSEAGAASAHLSEAILNFLAIEIPVLVPSTPVMPDPPQAHSESSTDSIELDEKLPARGVYERILELAGMPLPDYVPLIDENNIDDALNVVYDTLMDYQDQLRKNILDEETAALICFKVVKVQLEELRADYDLFPNVEWLDYFIQLIGRQIGFENPLIEEIHKKITHFLQNAPDSENNTDLIIHSYDILKGFEPFLQEDSISEGPTRENLSWEALEQGLIGEPLFYDQ